MNCFENIALGNQPESHKIVKTNMQNSMANFSDFNLRVYMLIMVGMPEWNQKSQRSLPAGLMSIRQLKVRLLPTLDSAGVQPMVPPGGRAKKNVKVISMGEIQPDPSCLHKGQT